jgi:glycosyltransferase involved in cell wall biosynthesis
MKITYIASATIPSLTANSVHVMKVCQAFTQLGHESHLIVPGDRSYAWADLQEHYGITSPFQIDWLSARPHLHKLDFFWSAVRRAKKEQTQLVYTRVLWAALFAMQHNLPVILEMHDIPQGRLAPRLYRYYLHRSGKHLTVFITHALQSLIEKELSVSHNPSEALVMPNGVDLERFANLPSAAEARRSLNLPEKLTAVYSGGFYAGRGLEILFELAGLFSQVQFIWVGGQPQVVQQWQAKIDDAHLTNVLLPGYISNQKLPVYQAAADILLMPSSKKVAGSSGGNIANVASPMKLFEYMASGKAILCSDLPVLHEVLNTNNAVFYPPDDLSALTGAFSRLLQDSQLRKNLGDQAHNDVLKYSWDERMQTILSYFAAKMEQ